MSFLSIYAHLSSSLPCFTEVGQRQTLYTFYCMRVLGLGTREKALTRSTAGACWTLGTLTPGETNAPSFPRHPAKHGENGELWRS